MVLVPANMPHFSFSPCNIFFVVFGPYKILFLKIVLENILFLKIVPFKDYFQKQNTLQGPFSKIIIFCRGYFSTKWASHHVTRVQIITKVGSMTKTKTKYICRDQKQQIFLHGLKPKRIIFAGTKTIFYP